MFVVIFPAISRFKIEPSFGEAKNAVWFWVKAIVSGFIIALAAWLSGRKPVLAGFVIALPLMSMLAIIFSYLQYRDMDKINQFTRSIVAAVPLSLFFFVPFLLNKWLRLNFAFTYALALGSLALAFFVHGWIFKTSGG